MTSKAWRARKKNFARWDRAMRKAVLLLAQAEIVKSGIGCGRPSQAKISLVFGEMHHCTQRASACIMHRK